MKIETLVKVVISSAVKKDLQPLIEKAILLDESVYSVAKSGENIQQSTLHRNIEKVENTLQGILTNNEQALVDVLKTVVDENASELIANGVYRTESIKGMFATEEPVEKFLEEYELDRDNADLVVDYVDEIAHRIELESGFKMKVKESSTQSVIDFLSQPVELEKLLKKRTEYKDLKDYFLDSFPSQIDFECQCYSEGQGGVDPHCEEHLNPLFFGFDFIIDSVDFSKVEASINAQ